ncbi:MAG TPA: alpha/beta hydrolase [Gemmataceae bacterium]|nr:alpha/beta hydrolase [Gemmataceae bacterium]
MRWLWLPCLVAVVLPAPAPAQDRPAGPAVPPGVAYHRDLTYCTVGKTDLRLDLALPKDGKGPFPCVVCVHGGGWHLGTRKSYTQTVLALARRGYVAATVSYRLSPASRFPAQINDVKCAVRWLRAHAEQYHIDKDRIGALGESAGGHLVCLLATTTKQDGLEGDGGCADQPSKVCCAVAWYPPTDLTHAHEAIRSPSAPVLEAMYARKAVEDLLGGPPEKAGRECYAKASPVTYVKKGAAPTLCVHGTADSLVPIGQSKLLEKKLKEAGVECRLCPIAKAGHGFRGKDREAALKASFEFLDEHLKQAKR